MTDNLELETPGIVSEDLPVSESSAVPDDDMQRPVFNKIQVQDVVRRERDKAYEKGKREALMDLQQQQAQQSAEGQSQQAPMQQPPAPQQLGGMQQLTQADIERMIAEQAPLALHAQVQQLKQDQMVNTFVQKMQAAEQKYPGLEAELNQLNYNDPRMHSFIEMANAFDNTGEIMKEVIDNPHKLTALLADVQNQPYVAQKQMQALSKSIKTNEDAKVQDAQARDPMSQIKPSTSAGIDNGAMSVTDFRKMFR